MESKAKRISPEEVKQNMIEQIEALLKNAQNGEYESLIIFAKPYETNDVAVSAINVNPFNLGGMVMQGMVNIAESYANHMVNNPNDANEKVAV